MSEIAENFIVYLWVSPWSQIFFKFIYWIVSTFTVFSLFHLRKLRLFKSGKLKLLNIFLIISGLVSLTTFVKFAGIGEGKEAFYNLQAVSILFAAVTIMIFVFLALSIIGASESNDNGYSKFLIKILLFSALAGFIFIIFINEFLGYSFPSFYFEFQGIYSPMVIP